MTANTLYTLSCVARLFQEDFDTLFMVAHSDGPGGLDLQSLDRETGIQLAMNPALRAERQEWGDTVVYRAWQGDRELGRTILAAGQLVPGVRVYLCRLAPAERLCFYYLQPGWSVHMERPQDGPPRLLFLNRPPAAPPGSTASSPKRRRGGPRPTPEQRRLEIIAGWQAAQSGETQEAYCARQGISATTLRAWIRALE